VHEVAPPFDDEPAGHTEHDIELTAEYVPFKHGVQLSAPLLVEEPAAHDVQDMAFADE